MTCCQISANKRCSQNSRAAKTISHPNENGNSVGNGAQMVHLAPRTKERRESPLSRCDGPVSTKRLRPDDGTAQHGSLSHQSATLEHLCVPAGRTQSPNNCQARPVASPRPARLAASCSVITTARVFLDIIFIRQEKNMTATKQTRKKLANGQLLWSYLTHLHSSRNVCINVEKTHKSAKVTNEKSSLC